MLFTPNNSGQRLPPTYYRGCWHVVSRGFLVHYRHYFSLFTKSTFVMYNRALQSEDLLHSRGVTAASRRSLGRVSVPMWPFILSDRLLIIALVVRYTTN